MLPVKTFTYSKPIVFLALCFYVWICYVGSPIAYNGGKFDISIGSILAATLFLWYFTRFMVRIFIPTIMGKSAITLDEEKIYHRPENKTIYWTDVAFISKRNTFSNRNTYIAFELMSGKETHVKLGFISGEYAYETIQKYFESALITDGQLGYTANNDEE